MVRFAIQWHTQNPPANGTAISRAQDARLGAGDLIEDDMHLGEYRSG